MFLLMPFGLNWASFTFSRLIDDVSGSLKSKSVILYHDDVEIFSGTSDERLRRLKTVLGRLKAANFRLKPSKCHFAQSELRYSVHIVDEDRKRPDPVNIGTIADFPTPTSFKA